MESLVSDTLGLDSLTSSNSVNHKPYQGLVVCFANKRLGSLIKYIRKMVCGSGHILIVSDLKNNGSNKKPSQSSLATFA